MGLESLDGFDSLFLMRPPQIGDIPRYFKPVVDRIAKSSIRRVVFLSVQGAEDMAYLPHAKIEKLLAESGLSYVFLRPGYFMSNLLTTLRADLVEKGEIFLPAGRLKFNWVSPPTGIPITGDFSEFLEIRAGPC